MRITDVRNAGSANGALLANRLKLAWMTRSPSTRVPVVPRTVVGARPVSDVEVGTVPFCKDSGSILLVSEILGNPQFTDATNHRAALAFSSKGRFWSSVRQGIKIESVLLVPAGITDFSAHVLGVRKVTKMLFS